MSVYHSECGEEMDVMVLTHNSPPNGEVTAVRYICPTCGGEWYQ